MYVHNTNTIVRRFCSRVILLLNRLASKTTELYRNDDLLTIIAGAYELLVNTTVRKIQ